MRVEKIENQKQREYSRDLKSFKAAGKGQGLKSLIRRERGMVYEN